MSLISVPILNYNLDYSVSTKLPLVYLYPVPKSPDLLTSLY